MRCDERGAPHTPRTFPTRTSRRRGAQHGAQRPSPGPRHRAIPHPPCAIPHPPCAIPHPPRPRAASPYAWDEAHATATIPRARRAPTPAEAAHTAEITSEITTEITAEITDEAAHTAARRRATRARAVLSAYERSAVLSMGEGRWAARPGSISTIPFCGPPTCHRLCGLPTCPRHCGLPTRPRQSAVPSCGLPTRPRGRPACSTAAHATPPCPSAPCSRYQRPSRAPCDRSQRPSARLRPLQLRASGGARRLGCGGHPTQEHLVHPCPTGAAGLGIRIVTIDETEVQPPTRRWSFACKFTLEKYA